MLLILLVRKCFSRYRPAKQGPPLQTSVTRFVPRRALQTHTHTYRCAFVFCAQRRSILLSLPRYHLASQARPLAQRPPSAAFPSARGSTGGAASSASAPSERQRVTEGLVRATVARLLMDPAPRRKAKGERCQGAEYVCLFGWLFVGLVWFSLLWCCVFPCFFGFHHFFLYLFCLSVCLPVCLSVCLSVVCSFFCLSVCPFVCVSACLCLSVCPFVCVCLFVCLIGCFHVCQPVCQSVCLSVCHSVCLVGWLFVCLCLVSL